MSIFWITGSCTRRWKPMRFDIVGKQLLKAGRKWYIEFRIHPEKTIDNREEVLIIVPRYWRTVPLKLFTSKAIPDFKLYIGGFPL